VRLSRVFAILRNVAQISASRRGAFSDGLEPLTYDGRVSLRTFSSTIEHIRAGGSIGVGRIAPLPSRKDVLSLEGRGGVLRPRKTIASAAIHPRMRSAPAMPGVQADWKSSEPATVRQAPWVNREHSARGVEFGRHASSHRVNAAGALAMLDDDDTQGPRRAAIPTIRRQSAGWRKTHTRRPKRSAPYALVARTNMGASTYSTLHANSGAARV
jgi:hypothetical protein